MTYTKSTLRGRELKTRGTRTVCKRPGLASQFESNNVHLYLFLSSLRTSAMSRLCNYISHP